MLTVPYDGTWARLMLLNFNSTTTYDINILKNGLRSLKSGLNEFVAPETTSQLI